MESRKDELLEAAIGYLTSHGLAELSLRPLAAEIGSSARLLIYHFGSKEGLLTEVLEALHDRLRRSFAKLTAAGQNAPPIKAFWNCATRGETFAQLKLLYELQVLGARNPSVYGRYLERHAFSWLELVQTALPEPQRTPAMATLMVAVFDGLFLELMSTGDRARTSRALDDFIAIVRKSRAVRSEQSRTRAHAG